jgi:hypothetical protein
MRRRLRFAPLLLLLVSVRVLGDEANWIESFQDDNVTISFHLDRIKRTATNRYLIWERFSFQADRPLNRPPYGTFRTAIRKVEIDCSTDRYREYSEVLLGADGKSVDSSTFQNPVWEDYVPESTSDGAKEFECEVLPAFAPEPESKKKKP